MRMSRGKLVNFSKVPGGDVFIHSKEVSHLDLTVSHLVPLSSWKLDLIPGDLVGKKHSSWRVKMPYNSTYDYKRVNSVEPGESIIEKKGNFNIYKQNFFFL